MLKIENLHQDQREVTVRTIGDEKLAYVGVIVNHDDRFIHLRQTSGEEWLVPYTGIAAIQVAKRGQRGGPP